MLLTCIDGASYSMNASSGALVRTQKNAGTSTPLAVNGQVIMTRRLEAGGRAYEGTARPAGAGRLQVDRQVIARAEARYLKAEGGQTTGTVMGAQKALDSSAEFGGGAPAAAGMNKAAAHLNVGTVAGGWAYQ